MPRWSHDDRDTALIRAAPALPRGPRRLGGNPDREASLNRTTAFVAAVVLACGAAALTITTPGPAGAAETPGATVQELREQSSQLRRQLAKERVLHRRALRTARRTTSQRAEVNRALAIAAATYTVSLKKLRRVAACESTLNPHARNGRYLGLFQFGAPLWRATPYRKMSRTDPYAAALAAAWAFKRGMLSHWPVCGRR